MFYGLGPTLTDEQKDYIHKVFNNDITFCNAIPGSGKTTVAVAAGRYLVESKKKKGIIYIFSPVEETTMGHRPGDQNEKEEAYLGPLKDALAYIGLQPDHINRPGGWVFGKSHTFLRGTNLEDYVIIIDEAQNYTLKELRKTLALSSLVFKEHTGLMPNTPFPALLHKLHARARGLISYRELGQMLCLRESRNTLLMYMGYAVKKST
jgi:hypothetical protein